MQSNPHKPTTHFTGPQDQKKYHQGLRSMLNQDQPGDMSKQQQQQHQQGQQQQQSPWNLLNKQSKQPKQQQQKQTRKSSAGSFSDDDLAALPVEKQFETDYDQTGHLVPDAVHFGKDQDMVGASNDDFSEDM
ncbi:hypothetical protein UA08_00940 [Talaromyces atroroseus]|uniref:Uncharacterized protein n=1 Tax=Talaromyces atroroseus TaxID=1441469 RepID=A0A225BB38_TALAT|nr:hypothetical protein UA08_00940 [Talaromyces atroroseus]OKL64626.1 hypothetical protein UA08_00940 [Talaromyces atroroseus]